MQLVPVVGVEKHCNDLYLFGESTREFQLVIPIIAGYISLFDFVSSVMGADAKRKEARKRRFGHIESHSQSVGVTATTTTRTTLVEVREDPKPATHQINRVLEGRGEIASSVIERTTQPGNSSEVQENPTSSKQARFICFIGIASSVQIS